MVSVLVSFKVLKDKLTQLKTKLRHLGDTARQLTARLDPVTSTDITTRIKTLEERADDLESRLQRQCERLESSMDERSKYVEKYRAIETFLETLPTEQRRLSAMSTLPTEESNLSAAVSTRPTGESRLSAAVSTRPTEERRLSAVSIPAVERRSLAVKETLVKLGNVRPELTQLNELSHELSLDADELDRLSELNSHWEMTRAGLEKEDGELDQRLGQLRDLAERCERWTQFVAGVEAETTTDLAGCSYESLIEQQRNLEVFVIYQ